MRIDTVHPPRTFEAGFPGHRVTLHDCARIHLEPDEQVTFCTESGAEYDLVRKEWGFYATPSLNGRLLRFRLFAYLVKNRLDQTFILLVEEGKEPAFHEYLQKEQMSIVTPLFEKEGIPVPGEG